ncbi:MAG TPA: agmatinase [Thermoanaerobaculia bacterium]|nr:agmatinase [Thermoanaerobaculia bacterium]
MSPTVNRAIEPGYAGLATFCKTPLALSAAELTGADAVIVGVPTDGRVTNRPGARFGPRAIRTSCPGSSSTRPHVISGVDPLVDLVVVDYGDVEPKPADLDGQVALVRERVGDVLDAGAVPIVLGGDHSLAYATVGAVSDRLGVDGFCMVQLDTHADTGEVFGGRLTHGTPIRMLIEEGSLSGSRLWQVGLRGYWPAADVFDWMRSKGLRFYTMDDVEQHGIDAVIAPIVSEIRSLECPVYLSVDIDVLDPAFAPGTGTPEPGGLTTRELFRAIRELASSLPVVGMEVVEVAPPYDHADITALAAHRCVLETLTGIATRRSGASASQSP